MNMFYLTGCLAISLIKPLFAQDTNTFPASGNVGIGTTSLSAWAPQYKLIDMYSFGYIYGSSNGTGFSGAGYGQTGWGNNTYYDGTSHAIGAGAASCLLQGTGYLTFQNAPVASAGSVQTFTERFRIDNNGNVGIGNTNPQNKLDVNGTIHSKQVNVDMTGWSDNVFEPAYNLPSLAEVQKYIGENHHPLEKEIVKKRIEPWRDEQDAYQKSRRANLVFVRNARRNAGIEKAG